MINMSAAVVFGFVLTGFAPARAAAGTGVSTPPQSVAVKARKGRPANRDSKGHGIQP